jgi:signal-transduction protein with cAMP-binding, CBS, and nucleotidyltransferase domain
MVMKEAVRLFDSIDGEEVLVDLCDEGDLFGVRAIFGTSAYLLSAQVVEESLLLAIPSESVEQLSQEREKAEKLLKMYIAQEVAIHFISNIFTELNDALIVKAIEFSVAGMKKEGMEMPDIEFCWLSLGSEGRKEQLLRTDQDNAILFRDPQDEASRQAAQQAFLELGKRVSRDPCRLRLRALPGKDHGEQPRLVPAAERMDELLPQMDRYAGAEGADELDDLLRFQAGLWQHGACV